MSDDDKHIMEAGFDHPCRETCSGWKQGYQRGCLDQLHIGQQHTDRVRAELNGHIQNLKSDLDTLKRTLADYEHENETIKEMKAELAEARGEITQYETATISNRNLAVEKIQSLRAQLKIAVDALMLILNESLDGESQKVKRICFESDYALAEIEKLGGG